MSQDEVMNIIRELGGKATSAEIRKRAKEKFPDATLYQYIADRLHKLEGKKVIARRKKNNEDLWVIIRDDLPKQESFYLK